MLALPAAHFVPAEARRPMTFEDLMKMRRLGDIDLSRDGKWVLFSATDVSLEKNTRTSHLWIVPTAGGKETALTDSLAGETRGRFSPDGKQILFLSPREDGQQIYLAPFDGTTGKIGEAHKLTGISTEADGATWSPDGQSILFTSKVYPDCTGPDADACNKTRDEEQAASKVKAKIFTTLLYRHWNAFTGDKRSHLFLVPATGGAPRDLNPGDTHDVPPFSLGGPDAYAFAPDSKEIAFEENLDPVPAICTHVDIFTLRLDDPSAKPVKITTSLAATSAPPIRPMESTSPSGRRPARDTRATNFGSCSTTGSRSRSMTCCRSSTVGSMNSSGRPDSQSHLLRSAARRRGTDLQDYPRRRVDVGRAAGSARRHPPIWQTEKH